MKTIDTFLTESFPTNPEDVILKNQYYPYGLKEVDVYTYYMKMKPQILSWTGKRKSAFFIRVGEDLIMKRKINGKEIKLTNANFEKLITGRTNQILIEHPDPSNYFVVDVDAGAGVAYPEIQKAVTVAMELLSNEKVTRWEKLFSGPMGIHLIGYMPSSLRSKPIIDMLSERLRKQDDYLVNVKGRHPGSLNYDLSSNVKRGLHVCRYSLSKEGLICDDLDASNSKAGKKI